VSFDVFPVPEATLIVEPYCLGERIRLRVQATGTGGYPAWFTLRERILNLTWQGTLHAPQSSVTFDWLNLSADASYEFVLEYTAANGCQTTRTFSHTVLVSNVQPTIENMPERACEDRYALDWRLVPENGLLRVNGRPVDDPYGNLPLEPGLNEIIYQIADGECVRRVQKTLEVIAPPRFSQRGWTKDFCVVGPQTLSARLDGHAKWKWYKDGERIANADAPTYKAETPGRYVLVAANDCGADTARFDLYSNMPVPVVSGPGLYCGGPPIELRVHGVGGDFDAATWLSPDGERYDGPQILVVPRFSGDFVVSVRYGMCSDTMLHRVEVSAPRPLAVRASCDTILSGQPVVLQTDVEAEWRDERDQVVHVGKSLEVAPQTSTWYTAVAVDNAAPHCRVGEKRLFVHELLEIPNVFTPNGDGVNDRFEWPPLFAQHTHVQIFDRHGTRVFVGDHPMRFWDGTFMGKPTPTGTYFYIYRYRICGVEQEYRGTVTLLR
ncbi:MAG: gliding motility-associated C-terminal domain-containing protein, partial [Bacteroidia bacterium]|nr:gliding motility-associated C-terminal domain-containing protein [Bacteroidia bacterium]